MKLDEGPPYEKLSLDITPLIDVVFLLVLFFAVSTSFISEEDLETLKANLLGLTEEKTVLDSQIGAANQRISDLELNVAALEQTQDAQAAREQDLQTQISQETSKYRRLLQQAKQAAATLSQTSSQLALASSELGDTRKELDQVSAQLLDERTSRVEQDKLVFRLQDLLAEKQKETLELELSLGAVTRAGDKAGAELAVSRSKLQKLEAELEKFRKIAEFDREQIERVLSAQKNLQSDLDSYLQNKQLGIKREKQRITLQLSDQILFDSGSPELKPQGVALLRNVGKVINSRLGDLEIQIGGHTDNIPISSKNSPWPSNWALSAARAVNVVRLLESGAGIDPDLLSAVGYGEYRPIADNATAAGRARNRRIEMVLVPR
ncbi:OmpA family protein [Gammaproteobacteria bacterium]|nr:OmpA family protein [Gammaproteobacteria bacterium]